MKTRGKELNVMATRNGSAKWTGDLSSGVGRVTVGDSAWTGDYSFASRFEDGTGTTPRS
jgi:osmotically inducible protein OsmC